MDPKEVAKQLRHPAGEIGLRIAVNMSKMNNEPIWLCYKEVCQYKGEYVLEIGFGNGSSLPQLVDVKQAKVLGMDYSELMVEEAIKKNTILINEGKLEIKHAEAAAIPYPDNYFHKIVTINTIYFWENPGW